MNNVPRLLAIFWTSWSWNHSTRIGIAALMPFIMTSWGISQVEAGYALSILNFFFYLGTISAAGLIRIARANVVLSLSSFAAGSSLILLRLIPSPLIVYPAFASLGFMLGTYLPNAISILVTSAPSGKRGTVVGAHETAAPIGQTIGPLLVGLLAPSHGVEGALLVIGAPWLVLGSLYLSHSFRTADGGTPRDLDQVQSKLDAKTLFFVSLLANSSLVGNLGVLNVLPIYLVVHQNVSSVEVANVIGLSRPFGAVLQLASGHLSDRLGRWRILMVLTLSNFLLVVGVSYVPYNPYYVALLFLQASVTAATFPVIFAYVSDLTGPGGALRNLSLSLGISGMVGVSSTPATVTYLASIYGYTTAFLYPISLVFLGLVAALLMRHQR